MKTIVTIIPTDLVTNGFYTLFVLSYKPETRIKFSASWWSGNEKCLCILSIESCALLQSHAEFNGLLQRSFITCYFCSDYSSMLCDRDLQHETVNCYCQNGREKDWELDYASTLVWDFLNISKCLSKILSRAATRKATCISSLSYHGTTISLV